MARCVFTNAVRRRLERDLLHVSVPGEFVASRRYNKIVRRTFRFHLRSCFSRHFHGLPGAGFLFRETAAAAAGHCIYGFVNRSYTFDGRAPFCACACFFFFSRVNDSTTEVIDDLPTWSVFLFPSRRPVGCQIRPRNGYHAERFDETLKRKCPSPRGTSTSRVPCTPRFPVRRKRNDVKRARRFVVSPTGGY